MMKILKKILILTFVAVACVACGGTQEATEGGIVVTIEPLRWIVEGIVGEGVEIEVLVPPGASPETYEPTPSQIASVERAQLVFSTGLLDFERSLLGYTSKSQSFVNLSEGIDLIEGTHAHHGEADHNHNEHAHRHGHHHGADPHVWMSPKALIIMAETAYARIHERYPDSLPYSTRYNQLRDILLVLDATVRSKVTASEHRSFVIFHPGLSYLARDYGLSQIAIEQDGKEPSARQLGEVIDIARAERISKVLYQNEFPRSMVEVVASEIGAEPVEIDILGRNIPHNILTVTDLIVGER
jgi:zinc transport system substrate-binding protein